MSDKPKVTLLGLPASTWVVLHLIAYVVVVLAVVVVVALNFLDNSALRFGNPAAIFIWGGFSLVLIFALVAIVADPLKRRREVRAGYTTLQNSYQFVEQRDPSTGQVLRAAGAPYSEAAEGESQETPVTFASDEGRQRRDAPAKPVRWWVGPAVLASVLVSIRISTIWIYISGSTDLAVGAERTGTVAIWLGLVALAIWVPLTSISARGRARDKAVQMLQPRALIVLASRTDEIRTTVRKLRPGASLNSFFVWAVDDSGLSIWQGGAKPERVVAFEWKQIEAVESFEYLSERGRLFAAASFSISFAGAPLRMPSLLRSKEHRLFPLDRLGVESTIRDIQAIRLGPETTAIA